MHSTPLPPLSHDEVARYSRHLILPTVGMQGQQRLKAGRVLCIGAGGLGSPALMYLAAAGVGQITVMDPDVVDASNLQRQVLHGTDWLARPKAASAAARMALINPHTQVVARQEAFSVHNAVQTVAAHDVVIDGTDNFATRYLINDACELAGKPFVYGSIYRFEGQASVFNHEGGPSYRDLYPDPPPPGLVPNCAEGGVLGVLPGIIGVIQATEAVKLLLGQGKTLSGRLLLYDALNMRFREISLQRDPHRAPVTALTDPADACGLGQAPQPTLSPEDPMSFSRISVTEAKAKLDGGWTPYVLDVRKAHEAEISSLSFVDRLQPHESVADIAGELPKDRDILIHCRSGGRSAMAAQVLAQHGFTRCFNLEGGINGWASEVDTSLPTY